MLRLYSLSSCWNINLFKRHTTSPLDCTFTCMNGAISSFSFFFSFSFLFNKVTPTPVHKKDFFIWTIYLFVVISCTARVFSLLLLLRSFDLSTKDSPQNNFLFLVNCWKKKNLCLIVSAEGFGEPVCLFYY